MFDSLVEMKKKQKDKTKYEKTYPFNTSTDGSEGNDHIFVYDVDYGYNVYEACSGLQCIGWFNQLDEAVEFAVDHARERTLNYQS